MRLDGPEDECGRAGRIGPAGAMWMVIIDPEWPWSGPQRRSVGQRHKMMMAKQYALSHGSDVLHGLERTAYEQFAL